MFSHSVNLILLSVDLICCDEVKCIISINEKIMEIFIPYKSQLDVIRHGSDNIILIS